MTRRRGPASPHVAPRAALRARVLAALFVGASIAHAATAHADPKAEGDAAMEAGRAAEALSAYERARELEPDRVELLYNIGRARLAIGDFAGALDFFEEFARKAPEDLKKKTHRLGEVMTELRSKVATIDVSDDGGDIPATVTLAGRNLGTMPLRARVNAGRAELRIEHPGYEPYVKIVDLAGTQTLVIQPRLVRLEAPPPIVTRLGVAASPGGAMVEVDGAAKGAAPLELEVAPGEHRVVVSAPRHQSRAVTLKLAPGETRRIDLQLREESPPITSRWWFWTGIGVVAAGVTTAIVAATVERSPTEGSLGTFRAP